MPCACSLFNHGCISIDFVFFFAVSFFSCKWCSFMIMRKDIFSGRTLDEKMAALYNENVTETRVQDLPRWSNEWENNMRFRISARRFKKALHSKKSKRRGAVTRIVIDIVSKKSPGYSESDTKKMCALYATHMKNAYGEVIKIKTPTAKSIEGYPELVCYADGVYQRNGKTRLVLFRKTTKHEIEDYVNMPSYKVGSW